MANKFLAIDQFGDEVELTGISTSAGVADANKMVATGADGRVNVSLMPSGFGSDIEPVVCSEALSAGNWVSIFDNAGVRGCHKASNLDATKPCTGFVKASFGLGDTAQVYLRGINDQIPIGTIDETGNGKKAFLGVAGATTLAPPTATGNYLQVLGPVVLVDEANSLVSVNFSYEQGIIRA